MEVSYGPFHFSSKFESGNLAKVLPIEAGDSCHKGGGSSFLNSQPGNAGRKSSRLSHCSSSFDVPVNYEFNLWTQPDCAGTEFENNNRTWFCFSLQGGIAGQRVSLSVMNLNRQLKLFSQGMQPVMQNVGDTIHHPRWERIKEKCSYRSEENSTVISWVHVVPQENVKTFYAFTYPYTYSQLQSHLTSLDEGYLIHSSIYYNREILVHSLDGLRVDLVTVTSHVGKLPEREDRLFGLFPDQSYPRPFKFSGKKVVFISARVHPGETSSSFVLNGMLNFILSKDPRAEKLRDLFVFKFVPMLNPDGVFRGHYRSDQRGVNLNRVYVSPTLEHHPTIYAARLVILYHHFGMQLSKLFEAERKNKEAILIKTKSTVSQPSLLDEDTCHSFGDAAGKTTSSIDTTSVCNVLKSKSLMDTDEPSASGWDVSSNVSIDSSNQTGYSHDLLGVADIHDDCSNFSCTSEGETGVTSMFCSLSPLRDFKTVQKESNDCASLSSTSICECIMPDKMKACGSGSPFTSSACPKCTLKQKSIPEKLYSIKRNPLFPNTSLCKPLEASFSDEFSSIASSSFKMKESSSKESMNILFCKEKKRLLSTSESDTEFHRKDCTTTSTDSGKEKKSIFPMSPSKRSLLSSAATSKLRSDIFLYVDLHGHASKRGIFMYGNWFEDPILMVENLLFPKLMSINCSNFDFTACNFSERNMYHKDKRGGMSKEGSGRVAVMQSTGLLHSYTLECNYNTGRTCNTIPNSSLSQRKSPIFSGSPPKYHPGIYEDCGRSLAISLLDIVEGNDWSRLPHSQYNSLSGVRSHLHNFLESSYASLKAHSVSSRSSTRTPKTATSEQSAEGNPSSSSNPINASCRLSVPKQQQQNISPSTPSTQRSRSKVAGNKMKEKSRRNRPPSVDTENQEPPLYVQTTSKNRQTAEKKNSPSSGTPSKGKSKSPRLKPIIRTSSTQKVNRSLTYTDIGDSTRYTTADLCSSKHSLTTSVSLTPNLNVKLSISKNIDTSKPIKKRKGLSASAKKLKMSAPCTSGDKSTFYTLPNLSNMDVNSGPEVCASSQGPLSPRSPLASVCEPQSSTSCSQTGSGLINVLSIQPKSPNLVTSSKKTFHSPIKRTKHSLKSLSKSMDRLPGMGSGPGQRMKLLPKKVKKKVSARSVSDIAATVKTAPLTSSQTSLDWIIAEPIKFASQIETKTKLKKRKKNRKSL